MRTQEVQRISQNEQLKNPDTRVSLQTLAAGTLLGKFAKSVQGIKSGDDGRVSRLFWELAELKPDWAYYQSTVPSSEQFGGLEGVIFWGDDGQGLARRQGNRAWGIKGLAVSQMASLPSAIYLGEKFDSNMTAIVPMNEDHFLPLLAYGLSGELSKEVRKIDASLKPTNGSFEKIPFDLKYWQSIASDQFRSGAPKPFSNNPTQWIFHGHPKSATDPLQVAVARLLGYQWPSEIDAKMELSDEARTWIARSKAITSHADKDGIVCIPPVGRESSASDRLLNLLADAYGEDWSNDVLTQLLKAADHAGKSLETWLRDKFFTQHCVLFGNRPFVWHVWDGLRDGFAALVNYHKLDYKTLEALIYTYLGDWISRQKRDAENSVDGAQEKLAAAEALKKRLELILAGEAPYDIFVRWKPIEQQPIGWNPDLNDGVRLNIRPFLSVPDVGKKGAGVLRDKPKSLHWEKDRGSDVPSAPWYELGLQYGGKVGDRINDHHLSLDEKRKAREKAK